MTKRKIRFALSARFPESLKAWQDYARKVEDLGFDVLLIGDHMATHWAPLIAIQAAADATTRLRFGTQVIANEFRNPALLAKEVATLNLLTDGRYEMGIGTGWPAASPTGRADSLATGIEFGENGPRVSKLVEALHIIKTYLSSTEPFDYEGKFYHVQGLVPYRLAPRRRASCWPAAARACSGSRRVRPTSSTLRRARRPWAPRRAVRWASA